MKSFVSITVIGLSVFSEVHAWGNMGHETVAYIAQNFISAKTKTYCQGILDDTTTSFLANAATWADTYRYTSAGSFSYPYHFIDAEDNPPTSCNVDYTRDCGAGGCSVSAINNYVRIIKTTSMEHTKIKQTNILLGGEDLDALKFIIHVGLPTLYYKYTVLKVVFSLLVTYTSLSMMRIMKSEVTTSMLPLEV
jgi:hypothetical protein